VDADAYHWTAALYIEQNPVRAGLVPSAEMYSYSSARAHTRGKSDPVLNASLFDEFDRKEYRKVLREPLTDEQLMETRTQTKLCKPLGSARFIRTVERLLGISIPRNRHSSEKR
jgi:putative transposase